MSSSPSKKEGRKIRRTDFASMGLTAVSLLCLLLLAAMTILYKDAATYEFRQPVILVYIAICCFGAIAAVLPFECSRIFHDIQIRNQRFLKEGRNDDSLANQRSKELRGHHPTCGKFAVHVLQVRGGMYCAGCTGLLTGAILAIVGSVTYSLGIYTVAREAMLVFWTGFVSVLIGLLQYAKPFMINGWVHYASNAIFVTGTFFLLLGIIEMSGAFLVEMYFLIMVLYWVLARIVLSTFEHQRTCFLCGSSSCAFRPN